MPPSSQPRTAATPSSVALLVLLGYLGVVLATMLTAGLATRRPALAAAHLVLLLVVALVYRTCSRHAALAIWLPVLALPLLYHELGLLFDALSRLPQDPIVLAWEQRLFGTPSQTLASRLPSPPLSELLHAGYLSYYPLIVVPLIALAVGGPTRRAALAETVLALTLAYVVCFLIFVIIPVEGPRYRFGAAVGAPEGPFRDLARALLREGSSRGTAFPSSHVAVAVALSVMALRHQRRLGLAVTVCAVLIAAGAVYGGFHYAVDVVSGALVGLLAAVCAIRLSRSHQSRGSLPAEQDEGSGAFSLPSVPGARDTSRTPR